MLENWLSPTRIKQQLAPHYQAKQQLIHHISVYGEAMPSLQRTQIALIGVGAQAADAVRRHLYALCYNFPKLAIADLGNLKKTTHSFIIPVLKELHDSQIIPIIIGVDSDAVYAQYQAHYTKRQLTNMVVVDKQISFNPDEPKDEQYYLSRIFGSRKLFGFGLLGHQSHFVPNDILKYFEKRHFETIRLGSIRKNMEGVEPLLRDADMMAFHLGAIRQADAPAQKQPSPNGLFGEEACQLCRYAGMSDKFSSLGFYGYEAEKDATQQTAQLIAQMIWYFMDGFYHRKHDFPKSTDNLVEYVVEQKVLSHQITFWKSIKSGRWWMQIPLKTKEKHARHRLIPCSYQDYQLASKGELPDRLVAAYQRFL